MNINLENSLIEKEKIIKKIKEAEEELSKAKYSLKKQESLLWTTTKFKELGLTNRNLREAYVDSHLADYVLLKEQKTNILRNLNRELDLCNDKIKLFS